MSIASLQTHKETPGTVLLVDDDNVFRDRLCRAFADRGWDALSAADGLTAVQLAEQHRPHLAIVDLRLPGMNGLEIIQRLRDRHATTCIILLTGFGSKDAAESALRYGANRCLRKPTDVDQILEVFRNQDWRRARVEGSFEAISSLQDEDLPIG